MHETEKGVLAGVGGDDAAPQSFQVEPLKPSIVLGEEKALLFLVFCRLAAEYFLLKHVSALQAALVRGYSNRSPSCHLPGCAVLHPVVGPYAAVEGNTASCIVHNFPFHYRPSSG